MARTEHPVTEDPNTEQVCSGCGVPKPRTLEFFPKDSWVRDGMSGRCKKCASEATIKSRRARREKERAVAAAVENAGPVVAHADSDGNYVADTPTTVVMGGAGIDVTPNE